MEQIQKKLAEKASAALSKVAKASSPMPQKAKKTPSLSKRAKASSLSAKRANVSPALSGEENKSSQNKGLDSVSEFLPFKDNGRGGFPYYYLDPRNLLFNDKTYQWISSSCSCNGSSVQLEGPFINTYIDALSVISYQLSSADEALFNQYHSNIITKQMMLILEWRKTYTEQSEADINDIIKVISSTWAKPATTMFVMLTTPDLHQLLNITPASGQPLLLPLAAYLNAINQSVSLSNASSMNTGYVTKALEAAQSPSRDNGAMQTNTNTLRPRYTIYTELSDILAALNNENAGQFSMEVALNCLGNGQCNADIDGDKCEITDLSKLFDLTLDDATCFSQILDTGDKINATLLFKGVSIVEFAPKPFNQSEQAYWYWNKAIEEAINNTGKDKSGFVFSPKPSIDFSKSGKFGFLTSAAISKHPSIEVKISSSNAKQIKSSIEQAKTIAIRFIERSIPISKKPQITIKQNDLTLGFSDNNSPILDTTDATAFVLGVKAKFPNANAVHSDI